MRAFGRRTEPVPAESRFRAIRIRLTSESPAEFRQAGRVGRTVQARFTREGFAGVTITDISLATVLGYETFRFKAAESAAVKIRVAVEHIIAFSHPAASVKADKVGVAFFIASAFNRHAALMAAGERVEVIA